MNALTQEMRTVANRVIWFESAEEALLYPERFLAYLMTYGTKEEVLIARKYFSDHPPECAAGNFRCSVVELLKSRLQTRTGSSHAATRHSYGLKSNDCESRPAQAAVLQFLPHARVKHGVDSNLVTNGVRPFTGCSRPTPLKRCGPRSSWRTRLGPRAFSLAANSSYKEALF
jgi:hypothetical protein